MKTKDELAKMLLLKVAYFPLIIVVATGAFSQIRGWPLWHWLAWIGSVAMLCTWARAYGYTKGFFLRHSANLSIIQNPGKKELYERIRADSWKTTGLALLTFSLCVVSFVLLVKYRMTIQGLVVLGLAIAFVALYHRRTKRLRKLTEEASVPLPLPNSGTKIIHSKGRFYAYFISLIAFSQLSLFLFFACSYLIAIGYWRIGVFALFMFSLVCLGIVPLLCGVVVKELGMPEIVDE